MNDTVADMYAMAVDCFITAIIVGSIALAMYNITKLNAKVSEDEATAVHLQEYARHNQFDNALVYPQDIVSTVMKYRGTMEIEVQSSLGKKEWSEDVQSTPYEVDEVTKAIDQTVVFNSSLIEGLNGEVTGYRFVQK